MREMVGVAGAGTMGAGIAQVAAAAGHAVRLYDAAPGAAGRAVTAIQDRVKSLAARGKLDIEANDLDLAAVPALEDLAPAGLVVEVIVEDLATKRALFAALEQIVTADCVLASNTSSLSPTALAAGAEHPHRFVGLHFFNPVPLMRLVEVAPGLATAPAVADLVSELAGTWGKTPVRSAPTPGFIVNRIARPFYAEAWRLVEERAAGPATVDAVLTGAGGFRMGPFALMDLIGHDVNEAVTHTVWTAFGHDPRFAPSLAQRALIEADRLGRKTGGGVYGPDGATPLPAARCLAPAEVAGHGATDLAGLLARCGVAVLEGDGGSGGVELPSRALLLRTTGALATDLAARYGVPVLVADRTLDDATATAIALAASDGCPPQAHAEAVGLLQAAGLDVYPIDDTPGLIVARTVAMLVNFAADALQKRVASAPDIDIAMRLGTNYPLGPLAWGDRWGTAIVHTLLTNLYDVYRDPRYRPNPLLRRRAATGGALT